MAFQFIHVSVYAREKPKKKPRSGTGGQDRKWTIRDIACEVEREPDHSPHVAKPLEPTVIYGIKASEAVAEAERRAEASKDVNGRKIRKDTPIALAGVASHPATVGQLVDPAVRRDYERWRRDTLEYLKGKYGDKLLSVVEHLDEEHPHVHYYAVPEAGSGLNAKNLHDGFYAARGAKDAKEQRRLYCEGMRSLQDEYFKQVGSRHGHARLGPRRRRMKRSEWLREQEQLQKLSTLVRRAKSTLAKAHMQATTIIDKARAEAAQVASRGAKLGAFVSGFTGWAKDALKRVARERDREKERRVKAEKHAEESRKQLVHERLVSDQRVDNLVEMKTEPLRKCLEIEQRKAAELGHRVNALLQENSNLKQQQQQAKEPRAGMDFDH